MSYRRSDTAGYAGRISDRLRKEFGDARLFRDIDTIKPGANFVGSIEEAVSSCSVFIALIGTGWLSASNSDGQPRLQDPSDYVRLEIAAALKRKIPIIPVLVAGATLPRPDSVPREIRPLFDYEAHELSDKRWAYDLNQLVVHLKDIISPAWRGRRSAAMVATVLMAMAALGGSVVAARRLLSHPSAPSAPRITRFAVVNPVNSTGKDNYSYLSTEIGDTLGAKLASPAKLNVIPPEDVLGVLEDLSVAPDQCSKKADPGPLRDVLGASYVIFGTFNSKVASKEIHILLCLEDAYGTHLDKFEGDTPVENLNKFATEAALHFRTAIGFAGLSVPDVQGVYPENANALRLYFDGLGKLRSFDARDALASLQQAAEQEDSNALIHSALAEAWSMLRHKEEAKREAKEALDRCNRPSPIPLPIEYREVIEARAAEIDSRWSTAADAYNKLYRSFPQRIDYGLKLASVQTSGSNPKGALAAIGELTKLPPPLGEDPRIFIEQSKTYAATADYKSAVRSAENAVRIADQKKSHLLNARALLQLCWAHRELGDVNGMGDCDKAEKIFEVFGDEVSAAVALNDVATWLVDRGQYADAKAIYARVRAVTETAHDQSDLAGALINSARVSILMGHPEDAEPLLFQARDAARSANDKYDEALVQINLADISKQNGRLAESAKQASEGRELARSIGDRSSEAYALGALALVQYEVGDLPGALQDYQSSLSIRQDTGEQAEVAITWTRLGDVYLRMGKFGDAEKRYRDALHRFGELKRPEQATQAQLDLAQVDLERDQFADSYAEANTALATIAKDDTDSRADALSFLVRALVGQQKLPEAQTHFEEMKKLSFSDPEVAADVSLAEGLFLTASGNAVRAVDVLETAEEKARKSGQLFAALHLQLAAVGARSKAKDFPAARKELAQLRAEAQSCSVKMGSSQRCGFPLISGQAAKLARASGL